MNINKVHLTLVSLLLFVILRVQSTFNVSECIIISLQLYTLLYFINEIGSSICFYAFLAFYSVLNTLVMPIFGYHMFDRANEYAQTWGIYMRVPQDLYYAFMIPANFAFIIGMSLKSGINNRNALRNILNRLRENPDNARMGISLTIIGFLSGLIQGVVPSSLAFILYLFGMLKFVGPLYIYYSDYKFRKLALIASVGLFFVQSIVQGLFGEFVTYILLMFVIVSVELRISFFNKLFFLIVGLFLVMVLQSVKRTYRQITWAGKSVGGLSINTSSHTDIFFNLFLDRLQNAELIFEDKTFFFIYVRMNQGQLISRVMDYVPRVEDYANGSTIAKSLAAVVVPRFVWPDKPEAGGRENLSRFMGIKKKHRFSMNIGPFGEGYGNFGPFGGVVFMLIYGGLLAVFLNYMLKKSIDRPSLILWLPLLFYYSLTVETDILTTVNSFVKGLVFVLLVYYLSKRFFNINP